MDRRRVLGSRTGAGSIPVCGDPENEASTREARGERSEPCPAPQAPLTGSIFSHAHELYLTNKLLLFLLIYTQTVTEIAPVTPVRFYVHAVFPPHLQSAGLNHRRYAESVALL